MSLSNRADGCEVQFPTGKHSANHNRLVSENLRRVFPDCYLRRDCSPIGIFPRREIPSPAANSGHVGALKKPHGTIAAVLLVEEALIQPLDWRLPMLDVLFIAVTVAFFAISLAYTAGCERL